MLYNFSKTISFLILKFFFHLRITGKENLPQKGGFILASNHVSYLDPVVLGAACPRQLNYMARDDLFYHPWFSRLISSLGAFELKRDSADISALKEAMKRLHQGKGLLLFPEGTRLSADRSGSDFIKVHAGVGFLAAKLQVPVVPAFIKGTEIALPKGAKFIKLAKISVFFGKQILIERRMPYQDIAREIMSQVRHLSCPIPD